MKMISATVSNVRKIEYATVQFDGQAVTVIGGWNEQGKSSFLDGIAMTLGGKALFPPDPIRGGEEEAEISIKLDGGTASLPWPCTVTRTVERKEGGTYTSKLKIISDDEYKDDSGAPQSKLDDVLGKLRMGFDPLQFVNEKPARQADILRDLVGLDFTELDRKRSGLYVERTEINRQAKQIDGKIKQTPIHTSAPTERVVVSDLMDELSKAEGTHKHNEYRQGLIKRNSDRIESINQQIAQLEQEKHQLGVEIEEKKKEMVTLIPVEPIREKIRQAEGINRQVDENKERLEWLTQKKRLELQSKKLTKEMEAIDKEKQRMMAEANWPIEGLGFGEKGGVTHDGFPFEQAASSRQLNVAVAIAFGLNPDFPFCIIRNGSLLDETKMAELHEIANDLKGQVLIERVSKGPECHVIFEDGRRIK